MKRLVSVLALSSLVSSTYAWTDASVNYYQPIAAFEALKKTDTNSKDSINAPNNETHNDYKAVTNMGEPSPDERSLVNQSEADMRTFHNIMTNDGLYSMILMLSQETPEHANAAQFVMLMREMHRMNQNLEKIIRLGGFHAQEGDKNDE